jgi:hypothetical protein
MLMERYCIGLQNKPLFVGKLQAVLPKIIKNYIIQNGHFQTSISLLLRVLEVPISNYWKAYLFYFLSISHVGGQKLTVKPLYVIEWKNTKNTIWKILIFQIFDIFVTFLLQTAIIWLSLDVTVTNWKYDWKGGSKNYGV